MSLTRRLSPLLFAASLLTAPMQGLHAHGGAHDEARRPVVDALPAALANVRVQLAQTLAPQLLVENRTGKVLEIMGRDGRPFLRLGPAGVEVDRVHPDWLASYLPGGLPGRGPQEPRTAPDWQPLRQTPNWGWFDPRLRPLASQTGWQIPVRLDGRDSMIRGHFTAASQNGYWQARWRQPPRLPAELSLQLVPGQPYGFMLVNHGKRPVIVLDGQQQPFLRLDRQGSAVRTDSPLWLASAAQQGLKAGIKEWQRLGQGNRLSWVDPRTRPAAGSRRDQPQVWDISLRWGDQLITLRGESRWRTATPAAATAER